MEDPLQKIECPLCNGIVKKWGEKNSHKLYKCDFCKLIFVSPIPDSSVIYNEDYFSGAAKGFGYVDYDTDKEPMLSTFNTYLDLCEKYGKKTGKLFDVGAATGFFLNIARKRGYEVSGVEVSGFAAEIARKKGLVMYEGDIKNIKLNDSSQDIVTMFDVVEHMSDPFSEINEAYRILKPSGLIIINTPNGNSLLARLLKTSWHLVAPPEHLYYFSPKNLENYLSKNGFTVLYSGTIGKCFTISYIFKTLYKWQKLKIWDYFAKLFSRPNFSNWHLPINLYDNFIMIAKKSEK